MRKWKMAAIAVVASLGMLVSSCERSEGGAQSDVYSRVLSSGVIRCGYVPYPPGLIKDPNNGHITGVFADAVQEAATNLNLRVEWTEEVGWGSMVEGLNANRYDMICSPVWANSSRARVADFTVPLFYSGIGAYVRADNHRLNQISDLNAASVRISTIDGEMSAIIAAAQFPNAPTVSLPQTSNDAQLLLNVVENRADVTFVEPYIAMQFMQTHPGALRNIAADHPLRVFGNTMMYRKGEERFGSMMSGALTELVNSGRVDTLLNQYAGNQGGFYPVARPYALPGEAH